MNDFSGLHNAQQSSHYLDMANLDKMRQQAQSDPNASLRQVAQQFEGIFLSMMLKGMRQANEAFKDKDSPFSSDQTEFFQEMHDSQLTSELSGQGSLGLADLIVAQLGGGEVGYTPASALRGNVSPLPLMTNNAAAEAAPPEMLAMNAHADGAESKADNASVVTAVLPSLGTVPMASAINPADSPAPQPLLATQAPLTFTNPAEFVEALMPAATEAGKRLGQDPRLLIAQAALETGWGKKILPDAEGKSSYNLFNIKADNRWQGDKTLVNAVEFEDQLAVMRRSAFRVYDNLQASFDDYISFLQQPRYQQALKATDASSFAHGLQQAGYATDPKYADKVLAVFQRLLTQSQQP